MNITGEFHIPAPRTQVWEALNDPEVLKECLPGCESMEKESDTELTARLHARVGPVSSRFTTKLALSDVNPPVSYVISGEGKGGAAGFARGGAEVFLEEVGDGTVLRYQAEVKVGGKLAQVGSRLIDGTARKLSEEFFANFVGQVCPSEAATPIAAEAPSEVRKPSFALAWAAAAVVVVLILSWWLFSR